MRMLMLAAMSVLAWPSLLSAGPALEVRAWPDRIYAWPLESSRSLGSVVLHNAAVVNTGDAPATIESLDIEVRAKGAVLVTETIGADGLTGAAALGSGLAKGGLLQLLAFQFRPDVLLRGGASLSATPTLAPRTAILVASRFIAFRGTADAVRVAVRGRDAKGAALTAEGTVPVAAFESKISYSFPVAGTTFVGAGATPHTGHRWAVPEQFALDIVRIGAGGLTHRGSGAQLADYFIYGAEVRAAADGIVRATATAEAESVPALRQPGEALATYMERVIAGQGERLVQGETAVFGNHVVIEHAPGEFSAYGHLQPGSVSVKVGESVKRGQVIARVGHSGNSTEPHLHFQLIDGPAPLGAVGLPIRFDGIELPFADGARPIQSGDIVVAQ